MSQFSNNPFLENDPDPQSRWPDISSEFQQQPQQYQQYQPQHQQSQQYFSPTHPQPNYGYASQQSYSQYPTSPQPQMASAQSYIPQQYPQPQQYAQSPYQYSQPQTQPQPTGFSNSALSQFDPYSSLGSLDIQAQQQPGGSQPNAEFASPTVTSSNAPPGQDHPRSYIQSHKRELETWDAPTWMQALNAFDALRMSWEARKTEITTRINVTQQQMQQMQMQYGNYAYGQTQQQQFDIQRWQTMLKEAGEHIDTIAVSRIQMKETLDGYRHSGDVASRNRVRSALNAGLNAIPDWPPRDW